MAEIPAWSGIRTRLRRWEQRWSDFSLSTKLNLALAALLLIMAVVILAVTQASLRSNTRRLLEASRVRELALRSQVLLLTQDDITKAMLLDPESLDLAAAKVEALEASQQVFGEMDSLAASQRVSDLISRLRSLDENELRPVDNRILEKMAEGDIAGATEIYFADYDTLRTRYGTLVDQLGAVADTAARDAAISLERDNRQAILISLLLGLTLVLTGVALFGRRIRRRLDAGVEMVERVAAGDLTGALADQSGDEIGRIASALNQMVVALRAMIADIQATSRQLIDRSGEIAAAAGQSDQVVRALDDSIQQVAQGNQEQARVSGETAGVMTELSGTITLLADRMRALAGGGNQRMDLARESAGSIQRAIHSLGEVREPVLATAAGVRQLGDRSEEIDQITKTIASIAEGTGLLALNAAIEAARAGEYGRGFAVVAAEVGKLAKHSAQASEGIAQLIRDIRKLTESAIAAVDTSTVRVAQSAEETRAAEPGLSAILQGLEETNRQLQAIATTTQEMLERVTHVSGLIDNVAAICQESAAAAEEISAQSHEVSGSMEHILAMTTAKAGGGGAGPEAESLISIADRLGRLVAGFRV